MKDQGNSFWVISRFLAEHKGFAGYEILAVISTSKFQLVLEMKETSGATVFLVFYLNNAFSLCWSQQEFNFPLQSGQRQFQDLWGLKVVEAIPHAFDRSFSVIIEGGYTLVAKLYGGQGNLLLYQDEVQKAVFRPQIKNDLQKPLADFSQELEPEKISTLLHSLANEFRAGVDNDLLSKWKENYSQFLSACRLYLVDQENGAPMIHFIQVTQARYEGFDLSEFLYLYAKALLSWQARKELSTQLSNQITTERKRLERSISAAEKQIERVNGELRYREWADIIMANLHHISSGSKEAELFDFYNNRTVRISLKDKLSPQENAEKYYKKAKNQGKEIALLEGRIATGKQRLEKLRKRLIDLEAASSVKQLKALNQEWNKTKAARSEPELPFLQLDFEGFKIYIGKNSKSNDELTLRFANKNDLWLHAKDYAGSHVLIKRATVGQPIPTKVVERAAELAAYYSKGKSSSICPVIYTERKYLRRPKGALLGQVKVDREEVILVRPLGLSAS